MKTTPILVLILLFLSCSSKEWTVVQTLEGEGNKKSPTFQLEGSKVRISYSYEAPNMMKEMNMGTFTVYVLEKGKNIKTDGGIPAIMLAAPHAQNEIEIEDLSQGTYFIEVSSLGGNWKINLKEYR